MTRRNVELIAAAGFALLFAIFLSQGVGYSDRSSYMPVAASGLGLAMCVFWALSTLRATFEAGEGLAVSRLAMIVAAGAVYALGFAYLGAFTATVIMLPGLAFLLGYRNPAVLAATTLGFVLIIYVVFRLLLAVPLPKELLLTLIGA